jgi:hypothetical protein
LSLCILLILKFCSTEYIKICANSAEVLDFMG